MRHVITRHVSGQRCNVTRGHVPLTLDGDLFLDPGLTEPSLPAVGGTKKFDSEAPDANSGVRTLFKPDTG